MNLITLTAWLALSAQGTAAAGSQIAKRWQSQFIVGTYGRPRCRGEEQGREVTGWKEPKCIEMGLAASVRIVLNHHVQCQGILVTYFANATCPKEETALRQVYYEMDWRTSCFLIPNDLVAHYSAWFECWNDLKPPQAQRPKMGDHEMEED